MADFPKTVLHTPKVDDKIKRLIQQAGKDLHFRTEKALYRVQDQILNLAEPLTCLWSDIQLYLVKGPRFQPSKLFC